MLSNMDPPSPHHRFAHLSIPNRRWLLRKNNRPAQRLGSHHVAFFSKWKSKPNAYFYDRWVSSIVLRVVNLPDVSTHGFNDSWLYILRGVPRVKKSRRNVWIPRSWTRSREVTYQYAKWSMMYLWFFLGEGAFWGVLVYILYLDLFFASLAEVILK